MNYTEVMLRLLDFLGQDPDAAYHVREVAEKAGVSTGSASITLRFLEGSRLLSLEERGGLKLYSFNLFNPVARQFKVLFTVNRLNDMVEGLKHEADRVVLFGSSSKGTDAKESDIDLLRVTRNPVSVREILRTTEKRIHRTLSPIIVPPGGLTRIEREDRPLLESILQGRVLWPRE